MHKVQRKQDIIDLLQAQGFSATQDLTRQLGVSAATMYRYLSELEQDGLIRKAYGGVSLAPAAPASIDFDYRARRMENPRQKQDIGRRAAELVEPGDTLMLDSSTTCVAFAQQLARAPLRDVTIVTNSARIVLAMQARPEFTLICTGGTYVGRHDTLVGAPAEELVASLTANKCFISAFGVTPEACTDSEHSDVRVKRLMLERARTRILLADHAKFGRATTFTVIAPSDLHMIVTDSGTSPETLAPLRALGLTVLTAGTEA